MRLIPPEQLIHEHAGGMNLQQFIASGDAVVQNAFLQGAKLRKDGKVLDIGCGCGKVARPLTKYLSSRGSYDGLDITEIAINWCKRAYSDYANFNFHYANIKSARYNIKGSCAPYEFVFPFYDQTFDLIYLGSVFTHMLPADVTHYLSEIGRVLKPNGICLATFFLLDDTARQNVEAGSTEPAFVHALGRCRYAVEGMPESAIAYDLDELNGMYDSHGLSISRVNFGEWGRGRFVPHWQDEVWSVKR